LINIKKRLELIYPNQHQLDIEDRETDFNVRLVQLQSRNFLRTLQSKLAWGVDKRN